MEKQTQMSDSVILGIFLALAGGFMDSYSYLCRDHVFANAQTGNMLLLGVNLADGNLGQAFHYFCPVMAFIIGIVLADLVRHRWEKTSRFHWRQVSVLVEAVILLGVCLIPRGMNLLANSFTSFACGIQVESFRKIHGNGIATTMCIGNLRSGTQNFCDYLIHRKKDNLKKCMLYYGIILCFMIGAVVGSFVIKILWEKAIFVCACILFIVCGMMFSERYSGHKFFI